jgi:peptidyl-tRNA hydrolase
MAFLVKNLNFTTDNNKHFASICFKSVELEWLDSSFRKITCSVDSLEELLELEKKAKELGIEANLITDLGFTEFDGVPTVTCLALGPDYDEVLDILTSKLKLY